ncbi:MAG: PepSY-like domain-containing protein, partial [Prevotella sp.]|nr:PepSY-like domain-containing protein [Prevotella sp.]
RVILSDNTKVYFTQTFEWVEVNCEHSSIYGAVPETLVPEQIAAYVTANYPNQHIDEIERENNDWEIELSNDVELKFDAYFNVINNGGNGVGNNTEYPDINTFVNTYFSQTKILSIKAEDDEYEVELVDGTEISFNLNFEWTHIDCEESSIYSAVPTELVPDQITAYVNTNFPDQQIEQIEKENYGWEIELKNGQEIKFYTNFNVFGNGGGNGGGTPNNNIAINTFVETYFPQVGIVKVEVDENEYDVKLTDGTEITFNFAFEWKSIDCDESNVYGIVPTELVPEQITAYVITNYPKQHIDKIEKRANGWEIELSNGVEIEFDSYFNVTHIDNK